MDGGRRGEAYFRNGLQNFIWQAEVLEPLGVVVGRVLGLSAGALRSIRSPGVLVDTLRVVLRFRLIKIFRLVYAAGGVIGNAHCSSNPTRYRRQTPFLAIPPPRTCGSSAACPAGRPSAPRWEHRARAGQRQLLPPGCPSRGGPAGRVRCPHYGGAAPWHRR